jgi:hypothetical protein
MVRLDVNNSTYSLGSLIGVSYYLGVKGSSLAAQLSMEVGVECHIMGFLTFK